MSGGSLTSSRRSFGGVSPVRTPTRRLELEPGERAAQVPLDVVVERLQRRDVEHAQPLAGRRVQPVDRVEERGQRLARAGRGLDQDVAAATRSPASRASAPASAAANAPRTRLAWLARRRQAGPSPRVPPDRGLRTSVRLVQFRSMPEAPVLHRRSEAPASCSPRIRSRCSIGVRDRPAGAGAEGVRRPARR